MRGICLAGAALLLASCQSTEPSALDAYSRQQIDDGVRQMASSVARDITRDGPNAWLRYFADAPGFFMANNGTLQFSSYAEAKTFLNEFSQGVAHLALTWGEIRVDPVARGTAVMACPYSEVLTDRKGLTTQYSGYFTGLAVKTDAGWKLRNAHWSSPLPSP